MKNHSFCSSIALLPAVDPLDPKQVDGHGFGRHSSALAVREMGGARRAHSDGCCCVATFTFELPVNLNGNNPGQQEP